MHTVQPTTVLLACADAPFEDIAALVPRVLSDVQSRSPYLGNLFFGFQLPLTGAGPLDE
ncbi:MAG: hypothetical protein AAGC55_13435 [Myxococcota bacterium]